MISHNPISLRVNYEREQKKTELIQLVVPPSSAPTPLLRDLFHLPHKTHDIIPPDAASQVQQWMSSTVKSCNSLAIHSSKISQSSPN